MPRERPPQRFLLVHPKVHPTTMTLLMKVCSTQAQRRLTFKLGIPRRSIGAVRQVEWPAINDTFSSIVIWPRRLSISVFLAAMMKLTISDAEVVLF